MALALGLHEDYNMYHFQRLIYIEIHMASVDNGGRDYRVIIPDNSWMARRNVRRLGDNQWQFI
jgi:hypothetical protein